MRKNMYTLFVLLLSLFVLILSGCDGPHFEDIPDSPVVEDVTPENPEDISVEYDPVEESYVKELYNAVCVGEWLMGSYVTTGNWMYSGEKNTVDTISDYDKQLIVWNAFKGDSDIEGYPSGDFSGNGDELIYHDYPVSLFEERFHTVFGPDAELTHATFQFSGYLVEYIEEKQIYCTRENHVWANYEDGYKWNKLVSYEQSGDELYLYDKFLYLAIGGDWYDLTIPSTFGSGVVPLYGNTERTEDSYIGDFHFDYILEYFNNEDILDENGYVYKHTFKRSENGTYYWVSSEPYDGDPGNATLVESVDNSQTKEEMTLNEEDVLTIYSDYFNYNNSDQDNALGLFYKDSKVDVSDLSQQQIKAYTMSFYDGDINFGISVSDNGEYLRDYSADRLNRLAKTLFGLDFEIDYDSFFLRDGLFEYNSEKNVFTGAFEEDKIWTAPYMSKMTDYEEDGDIIYIYDRVMTLEKAQDLGIKKTSAWTRFVDLETFEVNSIPYKHTFKRIGDKSYYWVSSEPVTE